MRRYFLFLAAAFALALGIPAAAGAAADYRVSGPVVHENLAIYFLHGPSTSGPVPLTLDEALKGGSVRVIETGNVNQLQIENVGNEEVFVQYGDIVKGGKQDRVLTVSLVLPPHSGLVPIASFCVEQGRWTARGKEDVRKFASAYATVPSREAKIAMHAPPVAVTGRLSPRVRPGGTETPMRPDETQARQLEMWKSVERVQHKLSGALGAPVASPQSQTSLQLSLENEKLAEAQHKYIGNLQAAGDADQDIVGYVFAVNGKLNSADVYPSNGLFRKMWPKLLSASVTEAIGERNADVQAPPATEAVLAFLAKAEQGKPVEKEIAASSRQEIRDAGQAYFIESRKAKGEWLHRSYLAK